MKAWKIINRLLYAWCCRRRDALERARRLILRTRCERDEANRIKEEQATRIAHLQTTQAAHQQLIYLLQRQLRQDQLTGLYSKEGMDAELKVIHGTLQRMGILSQTRVVIYHMDIDRFKGINDKYLHTRGDQALCYVAECIRTTFRRPNELACRSHKNGDEFYVISIVSAEEKGRSQQERRRLALEYGDQFRQLVADTSQEKLGFDEPMTVSVGVSSFENVAQRFTDFIKQIESAVKKSDEQMYMSKKDGRNLVR